MRNKIEWIAAISDHPKAKVKDAVAVVKGGLAEVDAAPIEGASGQRKLLSSGTSPESPTTPEPVVKNLGVGEIMSQ